MMGYVESKRKQVTENARERWFKNHVATVENYGDITTVNWRNKDGSSAYYVRFVFDGNYLFVGGDLGEAVFELTWNAKPTDGAFRNAYNSSYLLGKIACSRYGIYHFDSTLAKMTIEENIREYLDQEGEGELVFEDDEEEEIYNDLMDIAESSSSVNEFAARINEVDYSKFLPDAWEWIYSAGNICNNEIIAILVALQMVNEAISSGNAIIKKA